MITHWSRLVVWSPAISHLARRKKWTLILLAIKSIPFLAFWRGDCVVKWAKVATLSFVPFPPRPRALVYFVCSMKIIYRLDMNLGFDL